MTEIPAGWAQTEVGEVADIESGFGFPKDRQGKAEGDYPFAKVSDISRAVAATGGDLCAAANYVDHDDLKSLRAKPVPAGSVVFAKIGEALRLNRRATASVPLVLDNNCMALIPRATGIESRFLYRFMTTVDLSPFAVATSVPSVRKGDVASIALALPPLDEQRRIVAKLDALTARTARARADLDRIPALAARYRLSLLRTAMHGGLTESWRQQAELEPASALVGRTPTPQQGRGGREATTGVVPGQAALSVNDPGTLPPDGWAWTPLLRIARQETGHTPSRSVDSYWGGEVPWIGIRDAGAHHGQTIKDTLQTITEDGLANSSARVLPARTVCLSRTASVGYVTIMARPMATSQDFATWTCSEALEPEFLMYALMAEGDDIREFGEGSTHTTIYFPEIRALHICLPPLVEQQEIIRRIRAGLAEIDRLAAEAAAARRLLDRLDQAVLAKAFRGELLPQDPADEPANALLDRIRAERAVAPKAKRTKRTAMA